jgi:hypothetical protein
MYTCVIRHLEDVCRIHSRYSFETFTSTTISLTISDDLCYLHIPIYEVVWISLIVNILSRPSSEYLIRKLLLMGGIESNPGPSHSDGSQRIIVNMPKCDQYMIMHLQPLVNDTGVPWQHLRFFLEEKDCVQRAIQGDGFCFLKSVHTVFQEVYNSDITLHAIKQLLYSHIHDNLQRYMLFFTGSVIDMNHELCQYFFHGKHNLDVVDLVVAATPNGLNIHLNIIQNINNNIQIIRSSPEHISDSTRDVYVIFYRRQEYNSEFDHYNAMILRHQFIPTAVSPHRSPEPFHDDRSKHMMINLPRCHQYMIMNLEPLVNDTGFLWQHLRFFLQQKHCVERAVQGDGFCFLISLHTVFHEVYKSDITLDAIIQLFYSHIHDNLQRYMPFFTGSVIDINHQLCQYFFHRKHNLDVVDIVVAAAPNAFNVHLNIIQNIDNNIQILRTSPEHISDTTRDVYVIFYRRQENNSEFDHYNAMILRHQLIPTAVSQRRSPVPQYSVRSPVIQHSVIFKERFLCTCCHDRFYRSFLKIFHKDKYDFNDSIVKFVFGIHQCLRSEKDLICKTCVKYLTKKPPVIPVKLRSGKILQCNVCDEFNITNSQSHQNIVHPKCSSTYIDFFVSIVMYMCLYVL